MKHLALAFALVFATAAGAQSPYNDAAGRSAPTVAAEREVRRPDGTKSLEVVQVAPPRDTYGNAQGNQFDLAVDGAFDGQTVAVLDLAGLDLKAPRAALQEKGFSMFVWHGAPPAAELKKQLALATQLWIISSGGRQLGDGHVAVIKSWFDEGHGVYIWGDNEPLYADANVIGKALFGVEMHGNTYGDQPVGLQRGAAKPGVRPNHLISTGIETVYEGITIATIDDNQALTPLIHGSAGNVVAAIYEKDNKRAIMDGGFTRLFYKWDSAGTARYIKNAAAWLANHERFGDQKTASK
jgi:hypothetical protein